MTVSKREDLGSPPGAASAGTASGWRVAGGDPRYIFAPGVAQPIRVGSIARAAHIVHACNARDEALELLKDLIGNFDAGPGSFVFDKNWAERARAAISKATHPLADGQNRRRTADTQL